MIVKMRKLRLAALSYDRDSILNALERTRAVEINERALPEEEPRAEEIGERAGFGREALAAYLASLEETLAAIAAAAPSSRKEKPLADGFAVGYEEFLAAKNYRGRADELVGRVASLNAEKEELASEIARLEREIASARPYSPFLRSFSSLRPSAHTALFFGFAGASALDGLKAGLAALGLAAFEETETEGGSLLLVVCHTSVLPQTEALLSAASFSACPFGGDRTGAALFCALEGALAEAKARLAAADEGLAALAPELRALKIYRDYVGFELEKAEASEKMRTTARTFLADAFVPADGEARVRAALDGLGVPLYYEFSDPAEDEFVPTLTRNKPVVADFETITNMYSAPNAREVDPNPVMAFFFSVFLGFIMADMGYGILMAAGGFFLRKKKKGGIASLGGVFGVGGLFTFAWGFLFNSLFGISVLPFTVMPDAQSAMYSLAGIQLPAVLIIALLMGIAQLCAGYLCKFAQGVHRGRPWDGVFDGLVWAVFSFGALLAVIGLIRDFSLSALTTAGGIVAGVSLLVAVLTAGRHEKLPGKFSKGFGALYGLINYFTDVLSYIRLYGLMLTGAVIAQVVSQYTLTGGGGITPLMLSGNVALAAIGAVIFVAGHLFNLAISLLGAYIHTARLQYVEFFGRFYEGEGKLFEPLGSRAKYIALDYGEPAAHKKAAAKE